MLTTRRLAGALLATAALIAAGGSAPLSADAATYKYVTTVSRKMSCSVSLFGPDTTVKVTAHFAVYQDTATGHLYARVSDVYGAATYFGGLVIDQSAAFHVDYFHNVAHVPHKIRTWTAVGGILHGSDSTLFPESSTFMNLHVSEFGATCSSTLLGP